MIRTLSNCLARQSSQVLIVPVNCNPRRPNPRCWKKFDGGGPFFFSNNRLLENPSHPIPFPQRIAYRTCPRVSFSPSSPCVSVCDHIGILHRSPSYQLSVTLRSMRIARILSRTPRSRLGSRGLATATTATTSLGLTPRSTPIGLTSARSTRITSTLIPFSTSFSSRNLATMSGAAVGAQPEVASSQAKIIDGNAIAK